ncbi:MAG: hypothetical protein L3J00_06165, partial [Thiomicrorhabdus sp.]|nr:hypothetical protein [Thiomicrorhabdus sp.]
PADSQLVALGEAETPYVDRISLKYKGYLFVPGLSAGLHVYDDSNPLQPTLVVSLAFSGHIQYMTRHGDKLFAWSTSNRMYVISLADPAQPVLLTVVEDANYPAYVLAYGVYSYYLIMDGYLRVFDISLPDFLAKSKDRPAALTGELVALQAGDNFTLLGRSKGLLPAAVTGALALPDQERIVGTQRWQGLLVVLDENGRIQYFRQKQSSLELQGSLQLPMAQRWLTATNERLYVGGETSVYIIAKSDDGNFSLSAQIELPVRKSWDGLAIEQTLCLAAGKDGLLCLSLKDPDRPEANAGLLLPTHLESQLDVRQLATSGGRRVLAAAGAAGLLNGQINNAGQFQLDGIFSLQTPAHTLAVVRGMCLVSTATGISVIDIRDNSSLQNLGEIALPGVARFAVADPDFWAGYVSGEGWYILPAPRLVLSAETAAFQTLTKTRSSLPSTYRYRLNLVDCCVCTVSGSEHVTKNHSYFNARYARGCFH